MSPTKGVSCLDVTSGGLVMESAWVAKEFAGEQGSAAVPPNLAAVGSTGSLTGKRCETSI
eukprot:10797219-Ditylum_brightwellii.AAC.1